MTSHDIGFFRKENAEICGRGINYRISTRSARIEMNAEMRIHEYTGTDAKFPTCQTRKS